MSDSWSPLSQLLEGGCQQGVYTAAVALEGLKGKLLWQGAAGRLSRDPEAPAVTQQTVFDLASLTKSLATALALMVLENRKNLDLTTSLGVILPHDWLPADKHPLKQARICFNEKGFAGEVVHRCRTISIKHATQLGA